MIGPRLSTLSTRSLNNVAQNVPRDDDALDLARALADLTHLGIAHHAFDRVIGGIAVPAKDLNRLRGRAHGELRAEELGHGRLLLERLSLLLEPGGVIQEVRAGFDLQRHVRQLEVHALETADVLPELLPVSGVCKRGIVGALGDAKRQRRDADAAGIERAEEIHESLARRAEDVLPRDNRVLEDELARVARAPAHLVLLLACPDPGSLGKILGVPDSNLAALLEVYGVLGDDEAGDAAVAGTRLGARRDREDLADTGVRDEHLGAAQPEVISLVDGS